MGERDRARHLAAALEAEVERWTEKAQEAGKAYADANTKHHEELDRANRLERLANTLAERAVDLEDGKRAAEARVRRAEDALRAVRVEVAATRRRLLKSVEGPHVTNIMDAFCERLDQSLSAAGQTSEHDCSTCTDCLHDGQRCCGCYDGACCQTSDATPSDTLTIDPKRLTWDQRIPTAHEFGTWVESLPAGEFATGLLIIADALREREKGQTSDATPSDTTTKED